MMYSRLLLCLLCLSLSLPPAHAAPRLPAAPKTAAMPAPARGPDAPLGTFDLRDTRIHDVMRLVAELSGVNVVATEAVGARVLSLYLRDASARSVIDTVARISGLWYRYRAESGTYLLMTAEEYQRDISVFREEETRVFRLRHHNVVSAANALVALFGSRVELAAPVEEKLGETMRTNNVRRAQGNEVANRSPALPSALGGGAARAAGGSERPEQVAASTHQLAGREGQLSREEVSALKQGKEPPIHVTYNRLHNLLLVRSGDDKALQQAARLIESIDLPARQVLLEMRIVQVQLDNEFRRAFDADLFGGGLTTGGPGAQPPNPLQPGALLGPKATVGLGNFPLDTDSTGIFQLINSKIRLRLQLLEEQGKVQTLARPMVLASNNEPARLFIGEEVVLITGATSETTTNNDGPAITRITTQTEQRDVGTILVVHPRINADRTVTLTIDQENSRRVRGGTTIPLAVGDNRILDYPIDTVDTATIQVAALARDKLTIAVGGMIRQDRSDTLQQVPGLAKVPGLGMLFSRKVESEKRSELVLLITPHILDTVEEGAQVSAAQYSPAAAAASQRLDPRQPAELPATRQDVRDPMADYVALTQLALKAQAGQPVPQLTPAPLPPDAALLPLWQQAGRLQSTPGASWQGMGKYVTQVRLANPGDQPITVDTSRLNGKWLAATVESAQLAPGAGMSLILISDLPYVQAVQQARLPANENHQ